MSLPSQCVRRPIAVTMLFLGIILVGFVSLARLPIDLLPDVSYPRLVIYTTDSGASPSEVERSVTEPIERAVASVPGVQRVESVSREGVSLVTVRFAWGTDMDFAALNVREQLDNARSTLPVLASEPTVLRTDPRSDPIMALSVSGPTDLRSLKDLSEQVFKRRLEQLEGVAHAEVTGGLEREIHVEVDPARLESYGLTINDIAVALDAANAQGQGGTIRQGRYRYALRTLGEFQSVDEIAAVVLPLGPARPVPDGSGAPETAGSTGATILLRDVATITDGVRERESIARFSQAPSASDGDAVGILIFKSAGANTVQVAERVEATLDQLRTEYPEVRLAVATSQAGFISNAISNVVSALISGAILAFLVLFLFLRDPRYPLAISVSIPISVIGTFALLDAAGVSLNIMTLGGLALGVGMLVDNSIVVLENISRRREMGESPRVAAVTGAEEMQGAITASTLSTLAVFLPLIYVQGVAGELFFALSLAVTFSLLGSLLVALTLLPVLASRWEGLAPAVAKRRGVIRRLGGRAAARLGRATSPSLDAFDRGFARFANGYHALLKWSLDHRARMAGIAGLLFASSLAVAALLPRSVLPEVDQGAFEVQLEMEQGTPLDRTAEVAGRIEALLLEDPDVATVFTQIGRAGAFAGAEVGESGLNTASLQVRLADGAATDDVARRIRALLDADAASGEPGAPAGAVTIETGGATALGRLLGGAEADLAVRIQGDDLDQGIAYARAVEQRLATVPSLTNVRVGTELGQPEVRVEIDRDRAASFGIEPRAVAQVVERSMLGAEATLFADFDRRVPVIVRLPDDERHSVATLDELRVQGVPVRQLVVLHRGLGPSEVRRVDQGRVVPVFADVASGGLGGALADAQQALADIPPPAGLQVDIGGENEEMRRSFRDLGFAFALAILLLYMILAAEFESFVQPFTILLSVPLALVGAIAALAVTGAGLNTMSLIGIVILVGVVDNNAIIMVDLIIRLRAEGRPMRDAILEASRARLRPIIMTTITTVLGLAPMALGIGSGADLRAPLAIAVIGGLTVATLLTLVVIPVAYDVLETGRARLAVREATVDIQPVGEPRAPVSAAAPAD